MADVKIRVIADANSAIQNIQNITDSGVKADKSLTSLGKTLSDLESKQRKGENVSEEYSKQLENVFLVTMRSANAALAAGKGYEGFIKELEKAKATLFKMGATSAGAIFDKPLRDATVTVEKLKSEQLAESARKQKEYAEALAKALELEKAHNDEVERLVALAKNDPVEHMRYVYGELEKQLRKNIDAQVTLKEEHNVDSDEMKKLRVEASALSEKMNSLNTEMKKASRTPLNERMQNLVKSFVSAQVVVYGIRKALSFLTNTLKESAKAAAYAEETYNLFITTFEQVSTTADRVAISMGNALGIATSSAQKALGVFGDLLKGYGATDAEALKFAEMASQTALDIISFKNIMGSTDEVMQSFASGLAGNVENFRKLGYVITQAEIKTLLAKKGLDGLTGSALQQAMVQARLELVMKKATNALGDMEKTINSTVNVERRLNEAWLEYKENLGQDVNKIMSPLKRWWLDILDTTNKANEAKNRFMKGQSTEGIYNLTDKEGKDWKDFSKEISFIVAGSTRGENPYETDELRLNRFSNILGKFHASVDDLKEALGKNANLLTEEMEKSLRVTETNRANKEKADKEWENRTSSFLAKAQSGQGFLDELASLRGATINTSYARHLDPDNAKAVTRSSNVANVFLAGMESIGRNALKQAISSMGKADWTEFVSPLELALGKATEQSGLEAKVKEFESLYEIAYNKALEDGEITAEEAQGLQDIIDERQKAVTQLDALTKAEEERKKAEAELKALEEEKNRETEITITQTQDFIDSLNKLNGGNTSASVSQYLKMAGFGGVGKGELNKIASEAVDDIINTMANAEWSDFVSPIEVALEGITEKGSLESAVSELRTFYTLAYFWAMKDGEINKQEAEQLERIVAIRQEALDQLSEVEKAELIKAQGEELKDFGIDALGDIGTIIKAFDNIGASMGGWIGMLVQLASQLEIVQKIGNMFAETILPVLNQLLAPLMPVIENLFAIIREFLADLLQPLYTIISAIAPLLNMILEICRPLLKLLNALTPIIDAVSKSIALIAGLVGGALKFIEDSLKWLAGWIMKGVLFLVNGVIDILNMIPFVHLDRVDTSLYDEWASKNVIKESFQEGFDAVQDAINESNKFLADIETNTDNSKSERLKYLAELYKGGILSAEEYYAQKSSITGDRWDRTKFFSNGTYYNANGYTVARYGDVTVNIDGTNLSAEEVAEAVEKVLRPGAKSFQMAI